MKSITLINSSEDPRYLHAVAFRGNRCIPISSWVRVFSSSLPVQNRSHCQQHLPTFNLIILLFIIQRKERRERSIESKPSIVLEADSSSNTSRTNPRSENESYKGKPFFCLYGRVVGLRAHESLRVRESTWLYLCPKIREYWKIRLHADILRIIILLIIKKYYIYIL